MGWGVLRGLRVGEAMSRAPSRHTTQQLCSLCLPRTACKILPQERVPLLKGSIRTTETALSLYRLGNGLQGHDSFLSGPQRKEKQTSLHRGSNSLPRAILLPNVYDSKGDTATPQALWKRSQADSRWRWLEGKGTGMARLRPQAPPPFPAHICGGHLASSFSLS